MHDGAGLLPEWAAAELRRPVDPGDELQERIMTRIRAAAPPTVGSSAAAATVRVRGSRGTPSRGRRFAISGTLVALAASMAWMAFTPSILSSRADLVPSLRDAAAGRAIIVGDTVSSALHDTLRLVRFVLHAPRAARVTIAGDFNGWSRTATPLVDSARSGLWEAVVALERESGRYAFVVDDTQWVPGERIGSAAPAIRPLPATPVGGDST